MSMSNSTNSTAIVRYEQPTDAVRDTMMTGMVSPSTLKAYRLEQLNFITYLYDTNADKFISDAVLQLFHQAHQKDQENDKSKKTRKHLRECILEHLKKMNRYDNNCPIVLQHVSFSEFKKYMLDFRSKDKDGVLHYLSKSAYSHMKSAFGNLFKTSGQKMESVLEVELNQFLNSLSRKIAEAKVSSGQSLDEGKKPMSFAVYKLMCRKLLESDQADTLFAHTYLVLEWNLMSRAHMIAKMDVAHVEWGQDSLLFFFGKSKQNQTGVDGDRPFHVYSNPENPEICPVLALANYLVAYPDVLRSRGLLFPGSSQHSRFMRTFHATIEKHADEFKNLGVSKGDLGSHSCRDGSITLLTTGCPSPPMAAICIRAGWSLGPFKDHPSFYEKAGDQFVGRIVTGIPSLDCKFAISPVYWDWSGLSPDEKRDKKESLEEMMCAIVEKNTVPAATWELMQFLLAAMVKHFKFLNDTLDKGNKLRYSSVFHALAAGDYEELGAYAVVRLPWETTQFTPMASGIPPHILLLKKLEHMQKTMKTIPETILEGVRQELNDRSVGGSEFAARSVGGSEFAARGILEEIKQMIHDLHKKLNTGNVLRDTVTEDDYGDDEQPNPRKKRKVAVLDWQTHLGAGETRIQLAPPNFEFPKLRLEALILNWYCGHTWHCVDTSKNVIIPPYRMLSGKDLPKMAEGGRGGRTLGKMRKLMTHVERAARFAGRPELVIQGRSWTSSDCKALYQGTKHFFEIPKKQTRRFAQLGWRSYFNDMDRRKWQLVGEKPGEEEMHASPLATTTTRAAKTLKRRRPSNTATTGTSRPPIQRKRPPPNTAV